MKHLSLYTTLAFLACSENTTTPSETPVSSAVSSSVLSSGIPVSSQGGSTHSSLVLTSSSSAELISSKQQSSPITSSSKTSSANLSSSLSSNIISSSSHLSSSSTDPWAAQSGTFTDARDSQEYKWVKIDSEIWMAENLNFATTDTTKSYCYDLLQSNCDIYGRLYNWETVMNGEGESGTAPSGVQGLCPTGWHIPSKKEFENLKIYLGNNGFKDKEGLALKSTTGWANNGNGTDDFGFNALATGFRDLSANYLNLGGTTSFWSTSQFSTNNRYNISLSNLSIKLTITNSPKNTYGTLRCKRG